MFRARAGRGNLRVILGLYEEKLETTIVGFIGYKTTIVGFMGYKTTIVGFIGYRIWGVWGGYLCGSGVGEGSIEGHSRRTHGIKARLEYMGVCRNKGPQAPQHVLIRPEEPLKKPTNLNSIHPNVILASSCRIPPVRDPELFRNIISQRGSAWRQLQVRLW